MDARKFGAWTHFAPNLFFEDVFRPEKLLSTSDAYVRIHRSAITWLRKALTREPTLDDLNPRLLAAFFRSLAECGLTRVRIVEIRKCLNRLWKSAAARAWCAKYAPPPMPSIGPPARSWRDYQPEDGTLLAFYRTTFRPALLISNPSQNKLSLFDAAIIGFTITRRGR
jgi:hypothetical protein